MNDSFGGPASASSLNPPVCVRIRSPNGNGCLEEVDNIEINKQILTSRMREQFERLTRT